MNNKLFLTGPVEVREDVLDQMNKPMIGHRTPEFRELFESITVKLQELLNTKHRCLISSSSALGIMEGCVRNCVMERSLNLVNGAFGERWAKIVELNGKHCDRLEVDYGKGITAAMVEEKLAENSYDSVFLTHNETSTGVINPLPEIAEVVKQYPHIIFMVDCVTSMGGVNIDVDEWGIDVALSSNHKCFALPPIMTVFSCSQKAFDRSKRVKNRGFYFDFQLFEKNFDKSYTVTSPPIPQMFAMNYQLDKMLQEGLQDRYARHQGMAEYTRRWAIENGFALFAEEGFESPTVTCIENTKGIPVNETISKVKEKYHMEFATGYRDLNEKTFRIGHLGDITLEEVKELLEAIKEEIE